MSLYKRKGSEVWWSDLRHGGRRIRQSTGRTDKAAAQKREHEFQIELWSTVPTTEVHTWGEAVIAWISVTPRSDSELLSLAKFARYFPDRPLSEVSRDAVDKALAFCKTAGTYTRYRTMIAAILNLAVEAEWLDKAPKLASRRDKAPAPRMWLTPEQWAKLHAELPPHLQPAATFALETGLRQDNVLGLEWSAVSLERRLVTVEAITAKGKVAIGVPLNDAAMAILVNQQGMPAYTPGRRASSKSIHPGNEADRLPIPFVFPFRGARIHDVKTAFMAACIRAGVGQIVEGKYQGFTWHGLRHTWATWHTQNGTPASVLQALGAWRDSRMVANYAHHSPTFLAGFVNNVRKP